MPTETLPATNDKATARIADIEQPETDHYLKSPNVPGLVLRITPNGKRAWQVRYSVKVGNEWKTRKTTIGQFQAKAGGAGFTVKQAERKAEEIRVNARSGHDVVEQRQQAAKAKKEAERRQKIEQAKRVTMAELCEQWVKNQLQNPKTGHKDGGAQARAWIDGKILPRFSDWDVREFGKAEFWKAADPMLQAGHNVGANKLLSITKQMLGYAVNRNIIEANPLASLTRKQVGGDEPERERVLCAYEDPDTHEEVPDELGTLFRKLPESGLGETSQLAIKLVLATACRPGEILKAQWADVDIDSREWKIPARNSKNGKAHMVNLSEYAVGLMMQLQAITGLSEWLFPNASNTNHLDPKAVTKQVKDRQRGDGDRLKGRSKQADALILPRGGWTMHDLRRTAATLMAENGVMGEVVDRCLNHVEESKVKRTYNRHQPRELMREAWATLGAELERIEAEATHNI